MKINNKKLAVIVLGKRNAGKSSTWYEIFGRKIRTGRKQLTIDKIKNEIFVKNSSFEETGDEIDEYIFVKNSSFEEDGNDVEDFFSEDQPPIIFCSVQYIEKGVETINWFKAQGYYLYIQWLNPGYA